VITNSYSVELCASKVPIFENLNNGELLEVVKTINHKEYSKGIDVVYDNRFYI